MGLEARSFAIGAALWEQLVGGRVSRETVRKVTEGWGEEVMARRQEEVDVVHRVVARSAEAEEIEERDPLQGRVCVATDGGMVRIRGEGWREAKMTAISAIEEREARGEEEDKVALTRTSYQGGIWDADTLARYQYAEARRRGVDGWQETVAVQDGASWIQRVIEMNFVAPVCILDWYHAQERLHRVGEALWPKEEKRREAWVAEQVQDLWEGKVSRVIAALESLGVEEGPYPPEVQQTPGYLRRHAAQMRYPYFREQGYPIGSGIVEGAMEHVLHRRMRRPGPGWHLEHAQAMISALCELHSGRFDVLWDSLWSPSPPPPPT